MVNISDVDQSLPEVTEKNDRLDLIFQSQQRMIKKYHHIEKDNGLLQTPLCPVPLDDRFGQARLKDFAWRVTEELTEFTTATEGTNHMHEELGDVLHFLTELLILSGFRPEKVMQRWKPMTKHYFCKLEWLFSQITNKHRFCGRVDNTYRVIESLGLAMNCLKQKPWKQSHIATDVNKYNSYLQMTWDHFIRLCHEESIGAQRLFELYFLKNKVNHFRIGSNY